MSLELIAVGDKPDHSDRSPSGQLLTTFSCARSIVGDTAFTMRSSSLNVRSMALDSELNLLSQAKDVAFDLRKKLFKQCTNNEGPAQFGEMKETFEKWLVLMKDNTDAMAKGRPLTGQIATFHVDRQPGFPVI